MALPGAVIALESTDAAWLAAAQERYRGFLTVGRPTFTLRHTPGDAATGWALVDLDKDCAAVEGPSTPERADGVLRELLPDILEDALVMHGALLVDGQHGHLCCGPSGAGKSTLAALLPERVACDELVAVRVTAGHVEVSSLPFWRARPVTARLMTIHLLRHASTHQRHLLGPPTAMRRLRGMVAWPTGSPERLETAFAALARVAAETPVFDLGFAPRADVWRFIAGGESS